MRFDMILALLHLGYRWLNRDKILLIKLMGVVGLHGFIGALIAIPVVGYLCLIVYKTPGLCKMIVDTGIDLVKTGKLRVEAFNEIVDAVKA